MADDPNFIQEIDDDPFEEALRKLEKEERNQADEPLNEPAKEEVAANDAETSEDDGEAAAIARKNLDLLLDLEVEVYMEIGSSTMNMSDLLLLGQSSVIELDRLVGEDLDLVIGKKKIGKSEVVISHEKFAARIKRLLSQRERLQAVNSG